MFPSKLFKLRLQSRRIKDILGDVLKYKSFRPFNYLLTFSYYLLTGLVFRKRKEIDHFGVVIFFRGPFKTAPRYLPWFPPRCLFALFNLVLAVFLSSPSANKSILRSIQSPYVACASVFWIKVIRKSSANLSGFC